MRARASPSIAGAVAANPSGGEGFPVARMCQRGRPLLHRLSAAPSPYGRRCVACYGRCHMNLAKVSPPQAHLRPDADRKARAALGASRRQGRDLRQARRLQFRPRLRRQQGPQAGISRAGRAGAGLRYAGHDRRHPVEPYAAGGGGRRQARPEVPARAGELGRLSRRRLRPGRQHPDEPADGRACRAGRRGLRHQFQAELGAGARRRCGARAASLTPFRPALPITRSAGSAMSASPRR